MKYYISDIHFGHYNIIRMDGRPFENTEEMDKAIIKNWNDRVTDTDEVYIVGDVGFKGNPPQDYLKQLNGKKILIIGNHDLNWADRNSKGYNREAMSYLTRWDKMMQIQDNLDGEQVVIQLCHYPIVEWNRFFRGDYLVYGHIHNNLNDAYWMMRQYDKALNAACCINNYVPVTLKELIANNNAFKKEHLKGNVIKKTITIYEGE